MIKRVMNLQRTFIVLGTILISAAFLIILQTNVWSKEENLKKADGEIVVFFNNEISDDSLQAMTELYKSSIRVEKHIGDYALISVKKADDLNSVLKSLKKDPSVQSAQRNSKIKILGTNADAFEDSQWYIDNQGFYR
jgi:hypothetical protein